MDFSRGLITKIVDDETLNPVTRSGITKEFLDTDCISVFQFITRHTGEYKTVPDRDTVLRAFPDFQFIESKQPLDYFIRELKEVDRREKFDSKLSDVSKVYLKNTDRAEEMVRELLAELSVTHKTFKDVDVSKSAADRIVAYTHRKENPGADGILAGWSSMDYQTLGWHPEEFIVLVGEKYKGKSWIMIWLAYKAAMQGERVLFVTKEMSQEAVVRRFDSIFASVRFDALRRGELNSEEERRYHKKMEILANSNIRFMVARQGVNTVADIETKAVETDATIVLGDSIYLFDATANERPNGEVNRRMAVSQKCKSVAQSLGLPFIVSVQAGRKKSKDRKPTLDDIEWSNAFSQDADTVFFLEKTELDKELKRAEMILLKSREGDVAEFFIDQDYTKMRFGERTDEIEPTTDVFTEDDEGILN